MSDTPTYEVWRDMIKRCYKPKTRDYQWYGARGINTCEEWRLFDNFWADMGTRPPNLTLERKDNNGPYCKENCIWVDRLHQANNTRRNVMVEAFGKRQSITLWSRELDIKYASIRRALKKGITLEMLVNS